MKTEKYYLKDIEIIKNRNPSLKMEPSTGSLISIRKPNWHINDKMLKKFGNGKMYSFCGTGSSGSSYTHKCIEDGFFYHSSWFADVSPETIDPKPIEFAKPIHVNIDDLEIPE